MAAPSRPTTRDALAAFRHRNFRIFWIGALLSNTGSWLQNTTVPFVVWRLTESPAWVGGVAFLQFIPVVVVSPLGGSLADRYQRRTVLLVTQSAMAVVALAFWAVWLADAMTLPAVVALVVVSGMVAGVNIPSWQAFVSELVPRESLLNAVTLNSLQFNAARAFGPALGGVVLGALGVGWAFVINALSYAAVLVALGMVVVPRLERDSTSGGVLAGFRAAVRYSRGLSGVVVCLVSVFALGFLGGPVFSLLVVFAEDVFGVGDGLYGLLAASLGIGSILAAPLVAGRWSALARSRLLGASMATYGVALVVFALAPVFALAVAALVAAGGAYLAIASTLNTTVQLQVSETMRGKVLALYIMLLTVAMPLGSLLQGFLADTVGPRPTVAAAGGVFVVIVGVLVGGGHLLDVDGEGDPGRRVLT